MKAFYVTLGFLTLLVASLPYLYGAMHVPAGHVYTGLAYNIDDTCVYLSWMRQAADGQLTQFNRFTTEPQKGLVVNVFFLLLGNLVRLTHLPPIAVYHAARVICGGLLLWAVTRLIKRTVTDERAKKLAFALVCCSAGLGFLFGGAPYEQPTDLWQPEAFTFLSIYYTPLFTAALACMVVYVNSFLTAERSGKVQDLWPACLAGFLVGNFHSYDVIQLFALTTVYRIVTDVIRRRFAFMDYVRVALLGLAMLPTTAYQYYCLKAELVFYERAFVSRTDTESLRWILLGYGIVLVLAIVSGFVKKAWSESQRDAMRLYLVWATVAIAICYIPNLSFQRKLIMGAHLPLCLLAGSALAALTASLSGQLPAIAATAVVLITTPSNVLWLMRDMAWLGANNGSTHLRPYLKQTEVDALAFLRKTGVPTDAVLTSPDPTSHLHFPGFALMPYLSAYIPAETGHVVYNGHWSETARFETEKLPKSNHFFKDATSDGERLAFLQENGIRYILYVNALASGPVTNPVTGEVLYSPVAWSPDSPPNYLKTVYTNSDVTIYMLVAP